MTVSEQPLNITRLNIKPTIIPREQHNVSRSRMSDNALKVLYRLKKAGYKAYLVGGGVRDIILDREPKDFDVVTDAKPEQISALFRNCRLIGRRFRLAHVHFGSEIIEVSTFRAAHHVADESSGRIESGRITRDNVYGDIDDDVWRRDFTVNALFYNIKDFSIVDYVGGVKDLEDGVLKLIGDPAQRYIEDPVRMLRAIRFSAKLGLEITPEAATPIGQYAELLNDIPAARLFEEMLKLFMSGCALHTFEKLRQYDLFKCLFPQTDALLENNKDNCHYRLVARALKNTDQRLNEGYPVTPGFLLATFLWAPMQAIADEHMQQGIAETEAIRLASDTVITRQIPSLSMPRRFTHMARAIWALQSRLKRTGKRTSRVLEHPRFRAAYDFLLLRAEAGEPLQELVDYWTKAQLDAPLKTREKLKPSRRRQRAKTKKRVDTHQNKPSEL